MTGRALLHGRSAEPSLAEIHQEMSELLDKQLTSECTKRELEKLSGFTQAPASPRKSVMKMKETKKEKTMRS